MDIQKLIEETVSPSPARGSACGAWAPSPEYATTFEKIGEYYEITTPYLDNANDYIQIYVKQDGDELYITDDSATIKGLKMSGFQFTADRKAHLQRILNQYGIKMDGDELIAKTPVKGFAQKKHMFIQAIMCIGQLPHS